MRYDICGCTLLAISAFLYATRYFATAIFVSGPGFKDYAFNVMQKPLSDLSYEYVGKGLTIWAIVALIGGCGFFAIAIIAAKKRSNV